MRKILSIKHKKLSVKSIEFTYNYVRITSTINSDTIVDLILKF